jgi:RNA polymerase sigma-70 factor (sigma-E family)
VDFDDYVGQRRRALFRFAVVLTGDPVLADEVVSDVLATAYERWARVGAAENVHAYVRKMVLNEYLGWRRRAARVSVRADLTDVLEATPDHADASADAQVLLQEIRLLPPKQRAALVLRYYEGLPFSEIAQLLGSGETAVRVNVSRALAKLRIQLTDNEPAPATVAGREA